MASVSKCDRCGRIYNNREDPKIENGEMVVKPFNEAYILDLCAGCRNDLKDFMNNVTVYHRENDK